MFELLINEYDPRLDEFVLGEAASATIPGTDTGTVIQHPALIHFVDRRGIVSGRRM